MGRLIAVIVVLSAALLALLIRSFYLQRRLDKLAERMEEFLSSGGKAMDYSVREDRLAPLHNAAAELEDRILQANDRLDEERRRTTNLTADISHQLKTPLASLRLFCEMDAGAHLERELEQIDRMEQLITRLLELERLCADGYAFTFEECDVRSLLEAAWEPICAVYSDRVLEITGDCALRCDKKWMLEAYTNLLKNACEHTSAGGRIRVLLKAEEALFICRVSDNGGGAAKRDLPHLFERFYRAEGQDAKGAGIGLSIVKEIVYRHHGTIRAENDAQGLCMTMEIPMNIL